MNAIHITWTLPFGNEGKNFYIEDYDILSTILSALKWREFNGDIRLFTDSNGAKYYESIGISEIWNLGIDTKTLDNHNYNIDPVMYWAAGKILALNSESAPCAMLDTDFIAWKDVKTMLDDKSLAVIHREELVPEIYPPIEHIKTASGYEYDSEWSWSEPACNAAFVFFGNEKFKEYYTSESLKFMHNNFETNINNIIQMVFAEQRLMAMCAKKMNILIYSILNSPFDNNDGYFTHIWGHKSVLKLNLHERDAFCKKCIKRILKDFPDMIDKINRIESLKNYIKHL